MTKHHRVVLLDDHPGIRRVLRHFLDRTGTLQVVCDVSRITDLAWALESHHPDVVILDLELEQGLVASDTVAQIRELAPQARIVIYTAHSDFQIVTYMLDLGVEGYILKTDEMPSVARAIQEVAAGERRFSPGLTPILADGTWPRRSLNLAERGVLQMLSNGMCVRQVSLEMHIAERTVRRHVEKAVGKLGASSWPHAVALAMRKKAIR